VAVDAAGNAYVVGDFSSPTVDFDPSSGVDSHTNHGFFDAFLIKFAPNGNFLWARTWGGPGYDDGPRVVVEGSSHVYVAGICQGTADFDPGSGVDSHSVGGGLGDYGAFLSQFDLDGHYAWARAWGGSGWDIGEGVAVDGTGGVYTAGYFEGTDDLNPGSGVDRHTSQGGHDAFLSKFDAHGNFLWAKTWGGSGDDRSGFVGLDGTGNLYVAGLFHGSVDLDPGSGVAPHTSQGASDICLTRFDQEGNYCAARTWGGTGADAGLGLAVDGAGQLSIAGYFASSVDFDPLGGGETHTSQGGSDAFLLFSRAPGYALVLAPGWNLVSSPLTPAAGDPATFLDAIAGQYDQVFGYVASDHVSPWRSFTPASPAYANDLTHLDETMGFWIRAQVSTTLYIAGAPVLDPQIPLVAGWNLVGYPALAAHPITEALASLGSQVELAYAWQSGAWQVYDPAHPTESSLTTLLPGQGYWLKVRQACLWRPSAVVARASSLRL
jgi:hypothetical protein